MTKQAFDKSELMSEISRTKKELAFTNKKVQHSREGASNASGKDDNEGAINNSIKMVEQISI